MRAMYEEMTEGRKKVIKSRQMNYMRSSLAYPSIHPVIRSLLMNMDEFLAPLPQLLRLVFGLKKIKSFGEYDEKSSCSQTELT